MSTAVSRNAPLDAVRGLAAAGVFVFHTSNRVGAVYGDPYRVLGHFDVGVRVFFILSGYFIYRPFVRSHLSSGRGLAMGEYAWKRFWRVYPAYWVALAFALAIGYAELDGFEGVWKHGLLIQKYFGDPGGTGLRESWTLVVEVTLYALIPVYAFLVRFLGRVVGRVRAELGAGVALLVFAFAMLRPYVYQEGVFASAGLGRVLEPALLAAGAGMLLAVIDVVEWSDVARERIRRVAAPAVWWWCAAGVVFALLAFWLADGFVTPDRTGNRAQWFNYQWGHALIATLLVAPLVLAPGGGGRLRAWLSGRFVVMLGAVSFSLYLWHIRVLTLFKNSGWLDLGWFTLITVAIAFGLSVGAGWLGQRYLEQPFARIASRWPLVSREPRSTRP